MGKQKGSPQHYSAWASRFIDRDFSPAGQDRGRTGTMGDKNGAHKPASNANLDRFAHFLEFHSVPFFANSACWGSIPNPL